MAIINLYTGRDKVCHFVCILILYDPYGSQNLCFMILWTDNFILFIQVVFSSNHAINVAFNTFDLYTKGNKLLHFVKVLTIHL